MRRHAKASFATALALTFLAVACLPPASAFGGEHPFVGTFGSAEEPTFISSTASAVDQSTGDVIVIDLAPTRKILRYNADGTPDNFEALGSNEIDGLAGGADETPEGGLFFPSGFEMQIAVDNSGGETDGNIYVTVSRGEEEEESPLIIDIFASDGTFLGQLTEYKKGPGAEGSLTPLVRTPGVTVDPKGNVYVTEKKLGEVGQEQVHKYEPTGAFPENDDNTLNFAAESPAAIVAGAGPTAGSLFVIDEGGITKYTTAGTEVYEVGSGSFVPVSIDPSTGHLYVATFIEFTETEVVEFDASGATPEELSPINLPGLAFGMAVDQLTGHIYLSTGEHIEVYGRGAEYELTIVPGGSGTGTVSSEPAGINCGSECAFVFPETEVVELVAKPQAGSEFTGWSEISGDPGTCLGTTSPCEVTMLEAIELKATFDLQPTLSVASTGAGSGSLGCEINGGGLKPCTSPIPGGSKVKVVATPASGSEIGKISGTGSASSCATSPCEFLITKASSVTVEFSPKASPPPATTAPGTGTGKPVDNKPIPGAAKQKGENVLLKVTVPAAGQLTASGKNLKKATANSAGPGTVTLKLKLTAAGKKKLKKKGKLKVKVTLTFTPTGGTPGTATKAATFKRKS